MTEDDLTRDQRLDRWAERLGCRFDGDIVAGGRYVHLVREGRTIYVSGQLPRVGTEIVVTGRAGDEVPIERCRLAAQICTLRALTLLRRKMGTLDAVRRIAKLNVYVQSAAGFTQQSEVADGASDCLHEILDDAASHARTSIGVYQLPKGATVELDLIAMVDDNLWPAGP